MSISENEALASLKILVAVARADGTIHNDERKSLAAALESLELPSGASVDELLASNVDVSAELAKLTSDEAQEQIYRSAYFMAYADGACTPDEQAILDQIAAKTKPDPETLASLDRIFVGRVSGGEPTVALSPIADPVERAATINTWILRYAVLTAALGAFPIPGLSIATDLTVIALQLKMIRDLGAYWGHTIDRQGAKTILYGVGLGTGARLAISNLAKLLPGWGSVVGATTSFASTYALGKVIDRLLASGEVPTAETSSALRPAFRRAEEAARSVYADQEDVIIQSQRHNKAVIDALHADFASGAITREELDAKLLDLV